LDAKTTTEIMTLLSELNDQGCTIVVITHEDEVAEFCSRRVWLRDGAILSDEINLHRRHNKQLVAA
jgi:putative ABC transport system ATP-binding protein